MREEILAKFPSGASLILVNDPDGLLRDEQVLAELQARGFTILDEPDPVRLRYRYVHSSPPRIVVTTKGLENLPYDMWSMGDHVSLSLSEMFPNLANSVVQSLSPAQRERLATAPAPGTRLGVRATSDYILRHVFGVREDTFTSPAELLRWLVSYMARGEILPEVLRQRLLERLKEDARFAEWPLDVVLSDREALSDFLQEQWEAWLSKAGGMHEATVAYRAGLSDVEWQDLLPAMLRNGVLRRVHLPAWARALPEWTWIGRLGEEEDERLGRLKDLSGSLAEKMGPHLAEERWDVWQHLAREWAELTILRHAPDVPVPAGDKEHIDAQAVELDRLFFRWLEKYYSSLAVTRLPRPSHVHHVPDYLAFLRREKGLGGVALVVMDGMSLADWLVIKEAWLERHSAWHFQEERCLLAQLPTLTEVSRQALVSGRRPAEFRESLSHCRREEEYWGRFWEAAGMPADGAAYVRFDPGRPAEGYLDPGTQALCLIVNDVDDVAHSATMGTKDALASLRVWLLDHSLSLEGLLDYLLEKGLAVFLTSDHGHVEAEGFGLPREGVLVETRAKRAHIYDDEGFLHRVKGSFPDTHVWHGDGILPDDVWVLTPQDRYAFAPAGEVCVTHGGMSLEEVIVPFVHLTRWANS